MRLLIERNCRVTFKCEHIWVLDRMSLLRQIVCFLALAIASAGAMPLWLHHHACHLNCRAEAAVCDTRHSSHCCCSHSGTQASLSADKQATGGLEIVAPHDDCQICFHLSQATARPTSVPLISECELSSEFAHFYRQDAHLQVRTTNLSRGPPAA